MIKWGLLRVIYLNIISGILLRIFWWPKESINVCGHISYAGECSQERSYAPIIIYQVKLDSDGVGGGEGGGGGGAAVALAAGAITDLQVVTRETPIRQSCVDTGIVVCTVTHSCTYAQESAEYRNWRSKLYLLVPDHNSHHCSIPIYPDHSHGHHHCPPGNIGRRFI